MIEKNDSQPKENTSNVADFFDADMLSPWAAGYVKLILEQSGLNNLDADFKIQVIERLTEQVEIKLGMIIIDALDDSGLADMMDFRDKNPEASSEDWAKWFAEYIPDLQQRAQEGLLEYGKKFLAAVEEDRERFRQKSHDNLN